MPDGGSSSIRSAADTARRPEQNGSEGTRRSLDELRKRIDEITQRPAGDLACLACLAPKNGPRPGPGPGGKGGIGGGN